VIRERFPMVQLLRMVAGERVVFRTWVDGTDAVARVVAPPVPLALDAAVRAAALGGEPAPPGLPAAAAHLIASCQARARLGAERCLCDLVAAGVEPHALPGLPAAPPGHGYVYAATGWIEGRPLFEAAPSLSPDRRRAVLAELTALADRARPRGVALAALRPERIRLDGEVPRLVELDALVAAPPAESGSALAGLRTWLDIPADATVHVADPTRSAPAAAAIDPITERVPDPPAPWPPRDRRAPNSALSFALGFILVAAAVGLLLWAMR